MFGVDDIPDQAGRVVVVTGANGGLGFQTASVLAAKGRRRRHPSAAQGPNAIGSAVS